MGYKIICSKELNITALISLQQPHESSMENWIKLSVQWLFTFLSLFLRHREAKAHMTSATAPFLSAGGEEWTSGRREEEAVFKDRSSGTISGWRPHPWSPSQGIWSSSQVLFCSSLHLHTQNTSHHFSMFCLLESTQGTSTNLWKRVLEEPPVPTNNPTQ